jgi:hypothetical protein
MTLNSLLANRFEQIFADKKTKKHSKLCLVYHIIAKTISKWFYYKYIRRRRSVLMKTNPLAPIVAEILLCWRSAQEIAADSGMKLLIASFLAMTPSYNI